MGLQHILLKLKVLGVRTILFSSSLFLLVVMCLVEKKLHVLGVSEFFAYFWKGWVLTDIVSADSYMGQVCAGNVLQIL